MEPSSTVNVHLELDDDVLFRPRLRVSIGVTKVVLSLPKEESGQTSNRPLKFGFSKKNFKKAGFLARCVSFTFQSRLIPPIRPSED